MMGDLRMCWWLRWLVHKNTGAVEVVHEPDDTDSVSYPWLRSNFSCQSFTRVNISDSTGCQVTMMGRSGQSTYQL
jgi:hypothetical protein